MRFILFLRNFSERLVDYITVVLLSLLLFISIYAILDIHHVNTDAVLDPETSALEPDDQTYLDKLKQLRKLNPEIVAWLKLDDTNISRPITQTKDNNKYLTVDHLGEYSTSGSAFVDYRNEDFPNDDYTIIYGHRMSRGLMFSDITEFKDKTYFDKHKTGKLYTLRGIFKLDVMLFAVPNLDHSLAYNVGNLRRGANTQVIQDLQTYTTHTRDLTPPKQLLLLSTCDRDNKNYRDVLLLKMTKK